MTRAAEAAGTAAASAAPPLTPGGRAVDPAPSRSPGHNSPERNAMQHAQPLPGTTGRARRDELLDAIRQSPGDWTSGRAHRLYRASGWEATRTVARTDLIHLAEEGHLVAVGPDNARVYRLALGAHPGNGGWQTPSYCRPLGTRRKHRPR